MHHSSPYRVLYLICIIWAVASAVAANHFQTITTITADQMSMDNMKHKSVFAGHVLIRQDGIEISGHTLTIDHHNKKGGADRYWIDGPVTVHITPTNTIASYGYADALQVTENGNTIILLGHARLEHGRSVLTGERIEYNRTNDTYFAMNRTQTQQVEIVIHPK